MWWAIGTGIWAVCFVVVLALCKAAGDADRTMEEVINRKKEAERQSEDRAA